MIKRFLFCAIFLIAISTYAYDYKLNKGNYVYLFNEEKKVFNQLPLEKGDIIDSDDYIRSDTEFELTRSRFLFPPITQTYDACKKTKASSLKPRRSKAFYRSTDNVVRGADMDVNLISNAIKSFETDSSNRVAFEFIDGDGLAIDEINDMLNPVNINIYNTSDTTLYCVIIYKDNEGWGTLIGDTTQIQVAPNSQVSMADNYDYFNVPLHCTCFCVIAQENEPFCKDHIALLINNLNGESENKVLIHNMIVYSIELKLE